MIEIGRLCIKIAGRDAGKKCVIVEVLDDSNVMIDGETRRRKCNTKHLEPLNETVKIKAKADHATIIAEFKKLGIELKETKPKKAADKPKKVRKCKVKEEKAEVSEEKPKKEVKAKKE